MERPVGGELRRREECRETRVSERALRSTFSGLLTTAIMSGTTSRTTSLLCWLFFLLLHSVRSPLCADQWKHN